MRKINIAFVISNLGQGGAEKQLVNLITNLDKSRFDISLLLYAAQTEPFFLEELKRHQIKIRKISLNYHFVPIKIVEALYRINQFLRTNRFDIVVSSLFMNNLFVRLSAPRRYQNKIVTNMRTSVLNYPAFYVFFEKMLISKSYIVFNSNQSLENFRKIIPKKHHHRFFLIYNGYKLPKQTAVEKLPNIVFGSLGRLSNEKNVLQAVRVFHQIEELFPMCSMIVQGAFGNQYQIIKQSISSENIEIREKNPVIESFFSDINVLILPSIFEGCPNVLFEALLRKKICIVSKGANSDCFIQNGVNGFVYDGTDNGLFQALQTVQRLFYTHKANEIINNAYHYAVNNFSISTMIAEYENLFLKIYEENKSSN